MRKCTPQHILKKMWYFKNKGEWCELDNRWRNWRPRFSVEALSELQEADKNSIALTLHFAKSCPTICDPMDCSTPGFPIFHYLLQFVQTHVHWVCIAFNHLILCPEPCTSCSQSFPASGSLPISWLFPSGGQSIGGSAAISGFPMNIQGWFPLWSAGWFSLQSKGLSRVFFSNTIWKHQSFSAQLSL